MGGDPYWLRAARPWRQRPGAAAIWSRCGAGVLPRSRRPDRRPLLVGHLRARQGVGMLSSVCAVLRGDPCPVGAAAPVRWGPRGGWKPVPPRPAKGARRLACVRACSARSRRPCIVQAGPRAFGRVFAGRGARPCWAGSASPDGPAVPRPWARGSGGAACERGGRWARARRQPGPLAAQGALWRRRSGGQSWGDRLGASSGPGRPGSTGGGPAASHPVGGS